MEPITRGTTPTIELENDNDLTGYTCYLAIGKPKKPNLVKTKTGVQGEDGKTVVEFRLEQADTLSLKPGSAQMQLRAIKDNDAIASEIIDIEVLDVIQDGVLADED